MTKFLSSGAGAPSIKNPVKVEPWDVMASGSPTERNHQKDVGE